MMMMMMIIIHGCAGLSKAFQKPRLNANENPLVSARPAFDISLVLAFLNRFIPGCCQIRHRRGYCLLLPEMDLI